MWFFVVVCKNKHSKTQNLALNLLLQVILFCHLELIIQLGFNGYKKLFIIFHVFLQIMNDSRKKYVEITEKTGSDETYALSDQVESDLDEDIENEINDSDMEFFGNDELDYNSGSVANASDILVPAANVNSSSSRSPSWRWTSTYKPSEKVQCELTANIILHFSIDPRPFDVFQKAIDLYKLISYILYQTNLYASQNGCNFVTNDAKMKSFLGMNSMSINKLPLIEHYWSTDKCIGNQGLRDVMTKSRFKEILRNIHFSDNDTADSND